MAPYGQARAVVVGGSVGGLTVGLLLRDLGFAVEIFERTPSAVDSHGGGIVLQPDSLRWFVERSSQGSAELGTPTHFVQYLDSNNNLIHREQRTWNCTSWGRYHRALLADFGTEHYHYGEYACDMSQNAQQATVRFVSGRSESADLAVFADGINSWARQRFDPDAALSYAGYVCWRATVPRHSLPRGTQAALDDAITYNVLPYSQAAAYPIPGAGARTGENSLMNLVWYRNVPPGADLAELLIDKRGVPTTVSIHPGQVQDRHIAKIKQAAAQTLAPALAEIVAAAHAPFLQVLYDVRATRMAQGRIALIGDAACAARPHAAAGTAKAANDAWTLAAALNDARGDIVSALQQWEPPQLALSDEVQQRAIAMGNRSQVTNTWTPGDPDLRFGLHGPGA